MNLFSDITDNYKQTIPAHTVYYIPVVLKNILDANDITPQEYVEVTKVGSSTPFQLVDIIPRPILPLLREYYTRHHGVLPVPKWLDTDVAKRPTPFRLEGNHPENNRDLYDYFHCDNNTVLIVTDEPDDGYVVRDMFTRGLIDLGTSSSYDYFYKNLALGHLERAEKSIAA